MALLETILGPGDLRALPRTSLKQVADELRATLIEIGSTVGGHFAASLGTVELTIALHYAFDTPRDQLLWDVGHQAYGHKALTGRRTALRRVKRADGPSGFLRRVESEYDVFGAGHAGTSVSAALGIAEAVRLLGGNERAVAIIGDGAATAGMAFEAFNQAGHLRSNLCVILNDNGMSIAPNVGGLARTGELERYFGALGLRYNGPVDGHDLDALLQAVETLRDGEGARVLHVKTRKGKGYALAEADPFGWHATTPFDVTSGKRVKSGGGGPPSWTKAFAEAMIRLADTDERVVAITAAMPDGTGLDVFGARHPDRMYDVGIAEQHAVTFAAGMATRGLRPVCAIYSTFLQRAFDQVVHDVALQDLPVVFALDRAGLVGADGPTHHGALDLAYLRSIPNLVVAAPRDENELQHLLLTAVESGRPFALRFPRGSTPGGEVEPQARVLPIGKAEVLREGDDVALVAIGKTVGAVQNAAVKLARLGLSASVIDARYVKPLDAETLTAAAERCGYIVTVEDNVLQGGFGSAVLEHLSVAVPSARVLRLGLPDEFIGHGDVDEQWRSAGIDPDSIVRSAIELLDEASGDGESNDEEDRRRLERRYAGLSLVASSTDDDGLEADPETAEA